MVVLFFASLAGYFLSAVPLTRIAEEHGRSRVAPSLLASFYFPVALCVEHVPLAQAVAGWQTQFMDRNYGPPGVTTDTVQDSLDLF
jgi:hypothetical protein